MYDHNQLWAWHIRFFSYINKYYTITLGLGINSNQIYSRSCPEDPSDEGIFAPCVVQP